MIAERTAGEPSLGRPIRSHEVRPELLRATAGFSILAAGGTLVATVLGLLRWSYAYETFGPAVVWRWTVPYAIAGGITALMALLGLVRVLLLRRLSVLTFRHGMIHKQGRRNRTVLWDDIHMTYTTALSYGFLGLGRRQKQELLLVLADGSKMRLDNRLQDMDELADTIKEHLYPHLLADYIGHFSRGKDLPFGPLTLSRAGIHKGRRKLDWADFGAVRFERGRLVVAPEPEADAPTLRAPAQNIPNVELCAQLIERFGRQI